jgi:hypothetical protein
MQRGSHPLAHAAPVRRPGFLGALLRPGVSGFFLDGRREGTNGKRVALRLRLDEGRPLDVERPPGDLDRMLEPGVGVRRFFKVPPQESIPMCGIVAVIPSP